MAKHPAAFDQLISCLNRLPGIGRRSAERIAVSLVVERDSLRKDLAEALEKVRKEICCCARCGGLTAVESDPCGFCVDPSRDASLLCVVESPSDILLIESAGGYRGTYHVLKAKLSAMNRSGYEDLGLNALKLRLDAEPIEEVILALGSDVESDATAAFIREMLSDRPVLVSRPATGLPSGSGIAYTDALTLAKALQGRREL